MKRQPTSRSLVFLLPAGFVCKEERDEIAQVFAAKSGVTPEKWKWRECSDGSSELHVFYDSSRNTPTVRLSNRRKLK
jgi:hypothetical protein